MANATKPFALPSDEEVFRMREEERKRKEEERRRMHSLKVWEKSTATGRHAAIRKAKELLAGTGAQELLARKATGPSKATETAANLKPERRQEKENMAEFIARKREMFLVQMALDTKRDEIRKLEGKAQLKEEALKKSEQMLEEDAIRFDTFLKENDKKAHSAMKQAEKETKLKLEKAAEIKRLNQQIQLVQSDIAKYNEQLADCVKCKEFLDHLTPPEFIESAKKEKLNRKMERRQRRYEQKLAKWEKEKRQILQEHQQQEMELLRQIQEREAEHRWKSRKRDPAQQKESHKLPKPEIPDKPELEQEDLTDSGDDLPMYFNEPQQLLDIFTSLEEQNLFLIQNAQETEQQLEELRKEFSDTRSRMTTKRETLRSNVEHIQKQIDEEEAKGLALRTRIANSSGDREHQQEQLLRELHDKVKGTYEQCGFDAGTNPPTLFMLRDLEARLEDLLTTLANLPADYVLRQEKEKEKRRRERKRAEQQALHDKMQEDRNRRSIQRSLEAPKKRTGRKVMTRSQPVRRRIQEDKEEIDPQDLDEAKYLS